MWYCCSSLSPARSNNVFNHALHNGYAPPRILHYHYSVWEVKPTSVTPVFPFLLPFVKFTVVIIHLFSFMLRMW